MIKISDETELVEKIKQALKENDGYCPCKLEKKPENKCMCEEFKNSKDQECHCGLYIRI